MLIAINSNSSGWGEIVNKSCLMFSECILIEILESYQL
jgi:hypothetical protein